MAGPRKKINANGSKRFIRRDAQGHFTSDQVSVGKSLAADRRKKAKTVAKPGYGDQGDRAAR
jgi:hypothetical protein